MQKIAAIAVLLLLPGCLILEPRAKNPYPNLTTVAVAPFLNLSATPGEIDTLGHTVGLAYYSELQKTSGFDVLPMGVIDVYMIEHNLKNIQERDIPELAKALGVDAIVVGSVTYYDAYYPKQLGLKINWYSPNEWTVPENCECCDPCEEEPGFGWYPFHGFDLPIFRTQKGNSIIRGQNASQPQAIPLLGPDPNNARRMRAVSLFERDPYDETRRTVHPVQSTAHPVELLPPQANVQLGSDAASGGPQARLTPQVVQMVNQTGDLRVGKPRTIIPAYKASPDGLLSPLELNGVQLLPDSTIQDNSAPSSPPLPSMNQKVIPPPTLLDAPPHPAPMQIPIPQEASPPDIEPSPTTESLHLIMSYTKFFDSKDPEIVGLMRDYVEIQGDQRSGGWEGYMERTEDFVRFACHVMIVDMLSLHGGAMKTKMWLKFRKHP